jgi:uncharacterized protein (TIGR03066 family)
MKPLHIAAAVVLVTSLLGFLRAEQKKADNKTLIVGVWELTKASSGKAPAGTVLEFTKDGKLKMSGKADGKEFAFEGTYVVEGDKLTVRMKTPDRTEEGTLTIKKLTDKELVTQDDAGRVLEFKQKK